MLSLVHSFLSSMAYFVPRDLQLRMQSAYCFSSFVSQLSIVLVPKDNTRSRLTWYLGTIIVHMKNTFALYSSLVV